MPKVIIRPRVPADIDECIEVLRRVQIHEGYPRTTMPFRDFIAGPSMPFTWVAELDHHKQDDNHPSEAQQSETDSKPGTAPSKKIIGHVAIATPSDDDLSVRMWRRGEAAAKKQAHHQSTADETSRTTDLESDTSGLFPDGIAILQRLYVDPEARNSGAASALIETAVRDATRRGLRLVLFVLEQNVAARRLYERLGWEVFGTDVFRWKDEKGVDSEMDATCFANPVRPR